MINNTSRPTRIFFAALEYLPVQQTNFRIEERETNSSKIIGAVKCPRISFFATRRNYSLLHGNIFPSSKTWFQNSRTRKYLWLNFKILLDLLELLFLGTQGTGGTKEKYFANRPTFQKVAQSFQKWFFEIINNSRCSTPLFFLCTGISSSGANQFQNSRIGNQF